MANNVQSHELHFKKSSYRIRSIFRVRCFSYITACLQIKMFRYGSVSYTHLDVYKRQVLIKKNKNNLEHSEQ